MLGPKHDPTAALELIQKGLIPKTVDELENGDGASDRGWLLDRAIEVGCWLVWPLGSLSYIRSFSYEVYC